MIAGAAEPLVSLETEVVRVAFDPARNGAIVSVVDEASGRDFTTPDVAGALLYELRFADHLGQAVTLSERNADVATVKKEGRLVVVSTTHHGDLPVEVECRFRTEPGSS